VTQPRPEPRVATILRLPFAVHRDLRIAALERGETATALVERAIRAELAKQKRSRRRG